MNVRIFSPFTLPAIALLAAASIAWSATQADRVLVLRNTNSAISKAIADDYAARRGVTNVLNVACPDAAVNSNNESISYANYLSMIDTPLHAYLASHPGIDFIVTTKGIPLRLNGAQPQNSLSLDSYIASFGYDTISGAVRIILNIYNSYTGMAWANRFWNSKVPFSHAAFGGYLVTRLDGYTQAEAIGLTTRSMAAESAMVAGKTPTGKFLLDESPNYGTTSVASQPYSVLKADPPVKDTSRVPNESNYGDYNSDMVLAHDTLKARKIPDTLNTTNTFVGLPGLMGYVSWGSNDGNFNPTAYAALGFLNGGIGETAVSTSARTFLPTSGGQTLIVDLIHQGITGVKGYCNEPYLQGCASPSILFGRYTQGWTLAESFYAASNMVGWEDIVIGDPLTRAYPSSSVTAVKADASAPNSAAPLSIRQESQRIVFLFTAPMTARVSLEIISPDGKSIRTLSPENGAQAMQQFVWDLNGNSAHRVQPGAYAYRLSETSGRGTLGFQGMVTVSR